MGHRFAGLYGPRRLPLLGIFTVGFLLLDVVVLAPHLVHHIGDGHAGRPACPHFVQSQQAEAVRMDPPSFAPPGPAEALSATPPEADILPSPGAPHPSRAPPTPVASACS